MNFAALSAMQGGQDPLIQLLRGVMGGQGGMGGGNMRAAVMPQNPLARLMPMMGMKGMMGGGGMGPHPAVIGWEDMARRAQERGGGGQYHTLPFDPEGGMGLNPGIGFPGFPGGGDQWGGLFPGQQLPPGMMLPQPIGAEPGTAPNEGGMDRYGGAFKDEFWNPGFRGGFKGRPGSLIDVIRGMQGGPAGIFQGMDSLISRFGRGFKSPGFGGGEMRALPMPNLQDPYMKQAPNMGPGAMLPMPQRGVGGAAPLPMPAIMERDFGKDR